MALFKASAARIAGYDSGGDCPNLGLLGIMSMGSILNQEYKALVKGLSVKYNELWLVAAVLVCRMAGVLLSLIGTGMSGKEKLFTKQNV